MSIFGPQQYDAGVSFSETPVTACGPETSIPGVVLPTLASAKYHIEGGNIVVHRITFSCFVVPGHNLSTLQLAIFSVK
jgi:hypothetical protein